MATVVKKAVKPRMRPASAPKKGISKFAQMRGRYKGLMWEVGDDVWDLRM